MPQWLSVATRINKPVPDHDVADQVPWTASEVESSVQEVGWGVLSGSGPVGEGREKVSYHTVVTEASADPMGALG